MRPLSLFAILALVGCVHTVEVRDVEEVDPGPSITLTHFDDMPSYPADFGGGGYLPPVPYYVAHETMAQAMPPVGSPSWLAQAHSLTLTAPSGAVGVSINSGARAVFNNDGNSAAYIDYDPVSIRMRMPNTGLLVATEVSSNGAGINTFVGSVSSGGGFIIGGAASALTQGMAASGSNNIIRSAGPTSEVQLGDSTGAVGAKVSAGYLQSMKTSVGAPTAGDCDNDAERGRLVIDTTNNLLYVCNGLTRGWDTIALTN